MERACGFSNAPYCLDALNSLLAGQRARVAPCDRARCDRVQVADAVGWRSAERAFLSTGADAGFTVRLGCTLEEVENELIARTISFAGGNKSRAAQNLGCRTANHIQAT